MPIFSLPSNSGIGTLGEGAYEFIRFLKKSGQKYWQILPICPPAKEDSPYLSYSSRAGNPYLIDMDWLVGDGFLTKEELAQSGVQPAKTVQEDSWIASGKIDYKQIEESRSKVFSCLYKNFFNNVPDDFVAFCKKHKDWLDDYALFMTLLEHHNYAELPDWEDKYKYRDEAALKEFKVKHLSTFQYYQMLQYFFYTQWESLQKFAHKNDIQIIGDIPLYVSLTSSDAWVDPKIFKIDENYKASILSGVPANKTNRKDAVGQVWDSPVYDWEYLKKTNYKWWVARIGDALKLYDIIRIDHFKGFESYFNIDAKTRDTTQGVWKKGPGSHFWKSVAKQFGKENINDLPVFAEDLGVITPPLDELLKTCGFTGMSVLQYAFNNKAEAYLPPKVETNKNRYLPQNYKVNQVAYIGTHDNHTLKGYIDNTQPEVLQNAKNYFHVEDNDELFDIMIETAQKGIANTCILTCQDLLKLGNDAKNNTPGTVGINWMWQITEKEFKLLDSEKLYKLTKDSERL